MNLQNHIILINGVDKTDQVESIKFDRGKYTIKFLNSERIYSYSKDHIIWLTNPTSVVYENSHIFVNGLKQDNIKSIHLFLDNNHKFYAITYENEFTRHFQCSEVDIRHSCLTNRTINLLNYFRQCAEINPLGTNVEDESTETILSSIYSKINFIDEATAAAVYMDSNRNIKRYHTKTIIFPFGCNASQQRAVYTALSNQLSVIQGPPGTGKTQTILNIIANLLKENKSVLVVSNNNSATDNVLEKLAKNGLDFLVAPLGNKVNKESFISNQPILNPNLPSWSKSMLEKRHIMNEVKINLEKLENIFRLQERLAICRQELAEVEIEKIHYEQENLQNLRYRKVDIPSSKTLKALNRLNTLEANGKKECKGFFNRCRRFFDRLDLLRTLRYSLKIKDKLNVETLPEIIKSLEALFYISRINELKSEIESIEKALSQIDAKILLNSLTDNSLKILKASLANRYNKLRTKITSVKELYNNGEKILADYPIVLSTTFSSKTCFNADTIFDYVIMDEASQVSVETGLLALTCAKNAVIVGDTMQLPNVINEADRIKLEEIRKLYDIPNSYDVSHHSFLTSILASVHKIPETLLREHYRCHPDIINFCNQKFYGGNLIIMTKRKDDEKHLLMLTTSPGQHCRGHYNQREIDAIKIELLPLLDNIEETGIITPYNSQVSQFRAQIPSIEAATVHKYQGREKDTIIMSTTDDVITEFSDNANLLNVAVSRAKNKFCLVVSGNPQQLRGNIHDLINYIKYRQGVVIKSKLHSIFDYLFSHLYNQNIENKPISEYQSENLTFELIEKIRRKYPNLSHIKAICHYPMRSLINIDDVPLLSDREAKYALHPSTHIDFLILNRVSKEPLLAIETDGYSFHNERTLQYERDRMKDKILELYGLPLLRLSTVGHGEEQRIVDMLNQNLRYDI